MSKRLNNNINKKYIKDSISNLIVFYDLETNKKIKILKRFFHKDFNIKGLWQKNRKCSKNWLFWQFQHQNGPNDLDFPKCKHKNVDKIYCGEKRKIFY